MEREGELLFQQEPDSARSKVKSIADAKTQAGKPYKVLQFENGDKFAVWDAKKLNGIGAGDCIEYSKVKNDKGYWNLDSLSKLATESPQPEQPAFVEKANDREFGMRSMNALTNATNLAVAMFPFLEEKPKTMNQGYEVVRGLHRMLLDLHNPQNGDGNKA